MTSDSFKREYEKELKEIEELKGEFLDVWMFRMDQYLGNVNIAKKFYSAVDKKVLSKDEAEQQLKTIEESYNARKEIYGPSWESHKKTLAPNLDDETVWKMYKEYNFLYERLSTIVGEFENHNGTIADRGKLQKEIMDYVFTVERKFKRAIESYTKPKMPNPVVLPTKPSPVLSLPTPKKSMFSRFNFFSKKTGGKKRSRKTKKRRR
jgi:hypothetical protein